MRILRGIAALVILAGLVIAAPACLVASWRPPATGLSLQTLLVPDDGSLLVTVIVCIGWVAWLVFILSLITELIDRLTHGRIRLLPRSLRLPRIVVSGLLTAVVALISIRGVAPTVLQSSAPPAASVEAVASRVLAPEQTPEESTPVSPAEDATYLRYTVVAGDDLWSLAATHLGDGSRWTQIAHANPSLDPKADLVAGDVLRIPQPQTPAAPQHKTPTPPPTNPKKPVISAPTVTVQRGDNLSKIAERTLGDAERWKEIYQLNTDQIDHPDAIDIGWVLDLPAAPEPVAPTPVPPVPQATPPAEPSGHTSSPGQSTPHNAEKQTPQFGEECSADAMPGPESSGESPTSEHGHVAGDSAANPVALALAGIGPLLAAAVCGTLAARRAVQQWTRPPGRRFVQPGAEAHILQSAMLVAQADQQLSLFEAAAGHIADHCRAFHVELPHPAFIWVTDDQVTFTFQVTAQSIPTGFDVDGASWIFPAHRRHELPDPTEPQPYPALVTLGRQPQAGTQLLDLVRRPILGIVGHPTAVEGTVLAWLTELTTSPWSGEMQLWTTPDRARLLRAPVADMVQCSQVELVDEVERMAQARRGAQLPADAVYQMPPAIFCFDEELPPELEERIFDIDLDATGISIITPYSPGIDTWVLDGDPTSPTGRLNDDGPLVDAQCLSERTVGLISEIQQAADSPEFPLAPWWNASDSDHDAPMALPIHSIRQETAVNLAPPSQHPLLSLLGPIELSGAAGSTPSRGMRTCMEYCAWILEHPGSTAAAMSASLLVAESSRRSTMSRLRHWLGKDPDGELYLPEAYSGRIWLDSSVSSDWQQLQILIAAGVNRTHPDTLEAALGMIRGAVLADAAPGQWSWAEELRLDMMSVIRDIALVLTTHALSQQHIDLARWATARALTVVPEDEQLLCARIRTEQLAGNHHDVERLALKVTAQARRLGVDLDDDTIRLLQEIMEGRVRARSVVL